MKPQTWFLLSLMLFIAAAFFWRLGEDRVAQRNAKPKISAATNKIIPAKREVPVPVKSSARKLLSDSETNSTANSSSTNAPELYPHRLKNTSQTIDQLVHNDRAILLRNALIDTAAGSVKIPDELRAKGDPGSYIVQARSTADVTFRAALREAKAEIISYVPNNAYLVRLQSGGAEKLMGNRAVRSVLRYEPYYKLDTDLLALAMDKKPLAPEKMLRVTLFPGQRDSTVEALKGQARVVGEDLKSSPFGPELILASADLVQLANLPQVQEIEPFYDREVMNDLTRVRVGVSTNTVTAANYLGLSGSNVWVNVNDTTIDNSHPDLSPRIFPAAGVGITDPNGHGTHVAGIIASSGVNSPSGSQLTNVNSLPNANFRGKAPAASILSLDIFAGLSDAELQETAGASNYVALNRLSPLISNNSWGYGTRTYNSSAASFDAAVRDALPGSIGSQPIAYVFAAGNSGQGGVPGTVISPGTAKNVISVGTLENKRNITNDVVRPNAACVIVTNKEFLGFTDSSNQVASFSSRGNVGISQEGTFGRLKPDIIEPGTFIASTRSQQFDEASYYSPLHSDTRNFSGLVLDPIATNNFALFVPDNPCNEGATLSLSIDAFIRSPISTNQRPLLIYVGTAPNPSATAGNFVGTNSVFIPRASLPPGALNNILYYDIVNTNGIEIIYDLQTSLVLSNDFGNFFQVLSNLNGYLAPNYIFESGTSMSAPAISGMLALMQEFFEQRFQITNSPAMMKALLINGSRPVVTEPGQAGYDRTRSLNSEGWGLPDLRRILPTNSTPAAWPVQFFDQSTNSALATGERQDRVVTVSGTNSALRISLVWTDPPGNPAVGVKLVNDLDLIVTAVFTNAFTTNVTTNVYFGNNFSGGDFTQPTELGTNSLSAFDTVRDSVNNVENVYINGPVHGSYTVSVVARRVNVNAVTAHTNAIAQDFALVISSGTGTNAPFTVTTNVVPANTNSFVTVVSNGVPLFTQRVGANSPIQNVNANNLTDGTNTQWAFYVLNNPSNFNNIAFLTFLPPNLSGGTNTVPGSRRIVEADIDMYVSTDPTLTNLNPAAIAAADKSLNRGGQELIVYTNRNDAVFYVGIKSEDQRASEFSFFAIASETPFGNDDGNGNLILNGVPFGGVDIPDGSPDNPGGVPYLMFATSPIKIGRIIVTNTLTHERIGDLIETLTHNDISAVLLNHSFPDGIESATNLTLIYDDSGLGDVAGSRPTDGPGSLVDFVGEDGVGVWTLYAEDNAVNATGRVDAISMFIERALDTNSLIDGSGFTISGGIPPGESRAISFIVPPNTTNMIISISPKEGALDTVVRRGRFSPTRAPYVDKGTNIVPPGATLTVNTNDTPPLAPGRYVLRLFNDGGVFVNFTGFVKFELDLTARSFQTFLGGPTPLLDDAVTNSIINVNRIGRVVNAEVAVRIDHPRVSDLVMHLVSPEGTRILLAENRGGLSTNGYGASNLTAQTNTADAQIDGGAYTNIISTTLNSGILNINYEFFDVPDTLHVYYDGSLIFDSGLISGSATFSVPFGPGISTNIVIVINEGGNADPSTAWQYTAEVLSGQLIYATFSENTNLARVPIKFAIPPFATNIPGSNIVTFMTSDFEADAPGLYASPAAVDSWNVLTNSVTVENLPGVAYRGTNYLNLGNGTISRTLLATDPTKLYNLSFGYRRAPGSPIGGARISIGGIFTNDFIGTAGWIPYSQSFGGNSGGIPLQLDGTLPNMLFDRFELIEGGDKNYFLPEESLSTLIGEQARGNWKLEVWDNRAGQPVGAANLVSWQLHLTFTSSNATAIALQSGVEATNNFANGGQITYFIIDVPINATHATNTLISYGGPLNLFFNQNELPVGNPRFGDFTLMSGTVSNVYDLNTLTGPPFLQPGRRYYLGVQNVNRTQTNQFSLRVDFDDTNSLVEVTPLTNAVPLSTNLPLGSFIQYYQYDLSNSVASIEFKVFGLSGDVELVVRRGTLPTSSNYDYKSALGGTNDEILNVSTPLTGRYYLGVYGFLPTNGITYTIMATEGGPAAAVFVFTSFPVTVPGGIEVTANTIVGRTYELQFSTDLITWNIVTTVTATATSTTFFDPTPPGTQTARFYRLRLLP
ncbi:MAG: S8 family serine peptidase [Verrucomicrobiota bacterium]